MCTKAFTNARSKTRRKRLLTTSLLIGLNSVSYAKTTVANDASLTHSVSQMPAQTMAQTDSQSDADRLEKVLREAGIKAEIKSIKLSSIPDLFAVTLVDQPPLYISRDGHYVVQGRVLSVPDAVIAKIDATKSTPAQPTDPEASVGSTPFSPAMNGTPVNQAQRASMLPYLQTFEGITKDIPLYYTAVEGLIWGASIDGMPFISTKSGKTLIDGEIALLENGEFVGLDATFERRKNRDVLSRLNEDALIVYPATASQVQSIYVVTDLNCPYCRKLHTLIEELNAKGVTVNVIGYPVFEESFEPMQKIWCETDRVARKRLFDEAMRGLQPTLPTCPDNHLQANRDVSAGLAVFATPAIYRADGTMYQGNFADLEFAEFLGLALQK